MGHDDLRNGHERLWPQPDRGDLDGAVAELAVDQDGTVTAEIRIPGPAVP